MTYRWYTLCILLFAGVANAFAQSHDHHDHHGHEHDHGASELRFAENKGQWNDDVLFRAVVPYGRLFLERTRLTYNFFHEADVTHIHDIHHGAAPFVEPENIVVRGHAFYLNLVGANDQPGVDQHLPFSDYLNFYLGNDESRWASNVQQYGEVVYHDVYPDMDFRIYGANNGLKYDFIVEPGGNPDLIRLDYEGVEGLELDHGNLHIHTTVNEIIEQKPYAYQLIDGQQKEVRCNFKLENNQVTFKLGRYDRDQPLIIDPQLVFSSYSGSPVDNWGYTATYDQNSNLYAGGIAFGPNYPTSAGAYQTTFGGGSTQLGCDIVVTKFNGNGTNLLYSSYIGGSNNESPHSLVVNSNDELIVLGTTGSSNYPVLGSSYDNSFAGGPATIGQLINYSNGCDIILSKFNAAGTAILGSTFVGGTGNDGINFAGDLQYNYGDQFRGEVIVDDNDNVYVASVTASNDFPVAVGAPQPGYGGGTTDGVAFRLGPNLANLNWSTYLGGVDDDAVYGMQLDNNGNIFATGGTKSNDFPVVAGSLETQRQGAVDGFVIKLNGSGTSILAGTFLGTGAYDQGFLLQVDNNNDVYVVGQTEGNYQIVGSTYINPSSGQFLHKMSNGLDTTRWSTVFGTGSGAVDLTLSAFLVNDCDQIYISGWGGSVNISNGGPPNSTTTGLPVTSDATQSTTDGSDFYLMVLTRDAQSLLFATFYGGSSSEHVDGGTSRFDKKGTIYQAVCAGCGGNSDFPTSPGVWSNTNPSPNCNIGVIKYDLTIIIADAQFEPVGSLCQIPAEIQLVNNSSGAGAYIWDFGDGTTPSTEFEPNHFYLEKGDYQIRLIAYDPEGCSVADTDYIDIYIPGELVFSVFDPDTVCSGVPLQLGAEGGYSYLWAPAEPLNDPTLQYPTAVLYEPTRFTVTVTDSVGCAGTDSTDAFVWPVPTVQAGDDIVLDFGDDFQLEAAVPPNSTFWWSPDTGLSCIKCLDPVVTSQNRNIKYYLNVVDENGCPGIDSVNAFLVTTIYFPNAFTPNGDGKNDEFALEGYNVFDYDFIIFNRWGERVFQTTEITDGWDGTHNGKPAQIDTYAWKMTYTNIYGQKFRHFGHVTLVR